MPKRDSFGRFVKGSHSSTEFKKGQKAWNKGEKILGLLRRTWKTIQ